MSKEEDSKTNPEHPVQSVALHVESAEQPKPTEHVASHTGPAKDKKSVEQDDTQVVPVAG